MPQEGLSLTLRDAVFVKCCLLKLRRSNWLTSLSVEIFRTLLKQDGEPSQD